MPQCLLNNNYCDFSCIARIEVGIMYEQIVKGTIISRQGCISFKQSHVYMSYIHFVQLLTLKIISKLGNDLNVIKLGNDINDTKLGNDLDVIKLGNDINITKLGNDLEVTKLEMTLMLPH